MSLVFLLGLFICFMLKTKVTGFHSKVVGFVELVASGFQYA